MRAYRRVLANANRLPLLPGFSLLAMCSVLPAFARETKVIQKGSSGDQQLRAADATLNQANPTTKYGSQPNLTISSLGGSTQRAVVQMELSSLPNVAIKHAILKLYVTTAANRNGTYQAHRISQQLRATIPSRFPGAILPRLEP